MFQKELVRRLNERLKNGLDSSAAVVSSLLALEKAQVSK